MKKFLTVLLALSVVFTYSFSAAGSFAETKDEQATVLAKAKVLAEKMVDTYYNDAEESSIATTKSAVNGAMTTAAYTFEDADFEAAWKAVDAKTALKEYIDTEYAKEATALTNDNSTKYDGNEAIYAAKVFGISTKSEDNVELTASAITANISAKMLEKKGQAVRLKVFNNAKADLMTAYDNVDYSLYLDQVDPDDEDGRTYLKEAQDAVADAKKEISEDAEMSPADDIAVFGVALINTGLKKIEDKINADLKSIDYEGTNPAIPTGLYEVIGVLTAEKVAQGDREEAATLATIKADIQRRYVKVLGQGEKKANADAYVAVMNYLAEKGFIATVSKIPSYYTSSDWETPVNQIEDLTVFAAKYKAEKDATGAFVRDAKAVDAEVEKATNYVYGTAANVQAAIAKGQTIDNAEEKIKAMSAKTDAAELAFAKEVAKAAVEAAKAKVIDEYYPLEAQKVEAKFAEIIAEIEAATKTDKVTTAQNKIKNTTADILSAWNIKDKTAVDNSICGTTVLSEAQADLDAIDAYITYSNSGKTVVDPTFIDATLAQKKAALAKIYGEAGARTNVEIKALNVDASTIGATLPTVGAKTDAKNAVEAAVNALPAKATEADLDLVKAAWEAANKYEELGGTVDRSKLNAAINAVKADMLKNLTIEYAKLDKTDKEAVKALDAKVDAAKELAAKGNLFGTKTAADNTFDALKAKLSKEPTPTDKTQGLIQDIRDAELANVIKVINALPLNITLADKATVEAARAAYDAFVAEWTDYEVPYDASAKITNYRELALAEASIAVLQAKSDIKAVESLKVVKNHSVAGKGYIKIAWSVKGDAAAADGYQIYRATKANGKYTKFFTTSKMTYKNTKSLKKGTKYYYKVRAYKTVDGVKYYSDWSNKAYRVAK